MNHGEMCVVEWFNLLREGFSSGFLRIWWCNIWFLKSRKFLGEL